MVKPSSLFNPISARNRRASLRALLVLVVDGAIAVVCFWLAMMLRFDGELIEPYRSTLVAFAALLVFVRALASFLFRLHRWSFRFSGLADGARVAMAGLAGTGIFLGVFFLIRESGPPRSVVVLELLLSTTMMAAVRFSPRLAGIYASDWTLSHKDGKLRTVIVGAGSAGDMLLRDLQRSASHSYQVIGFVDDDPSKHSHVVGGKSILGRVDDLPGIVRNFRIDQVLIAIPRLDGRRIREILSTCADLKLRFKILPVSFIYLHQRAAAAAMQDLAPEDLLPREPVRFVETGDRVSLAGRVALVTGAAGSIGSEICEQLLRAGIGRIVMVDMNENGLYLALRRLERVYPQTSMKLEVADIRDAHRIETLFARERPDDVFHAAAHKHVPLMEDSPCEAVKNNILGTRHVARAADSSGAERFVYISTDKAVRPTSVMGASKRMGEELVRSMDRRSSTRFCAVRFGNVLGSAGSVVPLFQEQISRGGPVTVTHPDVRRYFMTISEAVALVLTAAYHDYGEMCVLDMGEQIRIVDLAKHMITMVGLVPEVDIVIEFSGLRPGEKLSEELMTEEEERTRRATDKILVADCPSPIEGIDARIDQLAVAAGAEDPPRVIALLEGILPSYSSFSQDSAPTTRHDATDSSAKSA